jgi:hypothetical protein
MRANYYLQFFDDIIKGEFHPEKLLQLTKAQLISRILAHQEESGIIIHRVIHLSLPNMPTGEIKLMKQSSNIFPYPIKTSTFPKTTLDSAEKDALAAFLNVSFSSVHIKEVKESLEESVVTFSFPLDLEEMDVNQLAYFYLNLSLKTQVEEIKENLRLSILEEGSNHQSPKTMIGSHLELIIHNIAIFYRRLDEGSYYTRTEMPIHPVIQDFFTLAGLYCEKVQKFLDHHFGAYIDRDKYTNPLVVDATLEQIKGLIQSVSDSLNALEDPFNIIPELHMHFNEMRYTNKIPAISYNRISFLANLINRLHEFFRKQDIHSSTEISFIELLIECNLNTTRILSAVNQYLESKLEENIPVELKIDYLRKFIKACNQRSLIQHPRYNSQIFDLSELIIKSCLASIDYLKESPGYVSPENEYNNQIYIHRKIKVNMNVSEMGSWFKLLRLAKIIHHEDMTLFFQYLSYFITPMDLDNLNPGSLNTRYKEAFNLRTIKVITDRLMGFLNFLKLK